MKTKTKTTRKRVYPILQQIVQYLPEWTLEKLANKHRVDARSFSATSHVVALMIAHLAHTSSLNETCDVCAMHEKNYAIDSTTIQLVLNCIAWAKHRRRKAAAKAHVLLNITSFLPSVVVATFWMGFPNG